MKIGFISLGCCKNQVDSEYLIGLFQKDPYFQIEVNQNKCDAILINTCGFINSAKQEAINTILETAELKKKNLKYLIVTGCLAQRYLQDLKQSIPEVDLFLPIEQYKQAAKILGKLFDHKFNSSYGKNRTLINAPYSAYLRVGDGCDNKCAYCAIPLIRGPLKSEKMENLIKEAKRLKKLGCKELNVIAQDTTRYGLDLYGRNCLKDLLIELDKLNFKWIRVLYMYPDEIDDDLLQVMKSSKHIIPYFDIPVQYGNTKMLKYMNRRGSVSLIKERIKKIREMFKDAYIRTTIIVGFPHESDETFNDTLKFIQDIKFDSLGAFTYSKEEDTKSYDMDEQVKESLKQKRYKQLMLAQKKIVNQKLKDKINKEYEVLVENYNGEYYLTRSFESAPDDIDSYVLVKGTNLEFGEFYKVRITGYHDYDLIGELI